MPQNVGSKEDLISQKLLLLDISNKSLKNKAETVHQ